MLKKKDYFYLLIIFLITFSVYFNTLNNGFVWDDHYFIFREEIQDLRNIPSFFANDTEGVYRPLREVFYSFAYALFGENSFYYHLLSLFIHISITFAVYFFIARIVSNNLIAFLTALFFGIHPIHTEAVSFITSSFDNIGILFLFLSLLFYINSNKIYYFISLVFFVIAIFTYEPAIVILPLLILIDMLNFNKNKFKRKIKGYTPYFAMAFLFLFIRFFLIKVLSRIDEPLGAGYILTLFTMPKIILDYIFLLFFPLNLSINHQVIFARAYFDPVAVSSFICLVFLVFLGAYFFRKNNKIISSSIFWFLITLLPFLNIIPLQRLIAEAYLYVPSLGFCLLLAYFIGRIGKIASIRDKKLKKAIAVVFILFIVFSYSFLTINRNIDWRDDLLLWNATVESNPLSSKAHNNLAVAYEGLGEFENALNEYKLSISINPKRAKPYISLGALYYKLGEYSNAKIAWEKAVELDSSQERIKNNIRILEEKGY